MKKSLILLTIYLLVTGCSIPKKPEFKYIDRISVKNISMRDITVTADAIFNNPNNIAGFLSIDDIRIFVDNIEVGTVSSKEFEVPSKKEFSIPLEGKVSLSRIYKDHKTNILSSILKTIQTDSIDVTYKGAIRYHLGDFSYPYKINKQQKISIQK